MYNGELSEADLEGLTGGAVDLDAQLIQFANAHPDVFNNLDAMAQEEVRLGILSNSTREYLTMVRDAMTKADDPTEFTEEDWNEFDAGGYKNGARGM